jgi:hypothetical protein
MSSEMELVVDAGGDVRCVYGEELDLREIGKLQITRASHVEPDRDGFWWADMGPVDGPVLGPFKNRSEALGAEVIFIRLISAYRNNHTLCEARPSSCRSEMYLDSPAQFLGAGKSL